MIQSFEIKNFKSIKSKFFPFRNLNILMGLNGMGKSSLIEPLLCLRQSRFLEKGRLDPNGDYVSLGKTKDVFYQYSKNEDLVLDVQFSDSQRINLCLEYKPEADYFYSRDIDVFRQIEAKLIPIIQSDESLFNDNFQYLSANRIEPKHIHPQNFSQVVNKRNLGNQGEFTAHFIEVFGSEFVFFDNLLHPDSIKKDNLTGKDIVNKSILNQINLWLGEISPDIQVVVTSISSDYIILEYQYKQPNFGFTNKFKPENVGFGISYVLPVVVALVSAQPNQLIIIENPESHIHPRGQAELGKLIALVAQNDVQIIIETHSDHILNGIRVAVKENLVDKSKVNVMYFDKVITPNEQFTKVTQIKVDKNGTLSEYPKAFLDEWSNQISKLI